MSSTNGKPTPKQLDILRQLAAREAARRQSEAQSSSSVVGDPSAASTPAPEEDGKDASQLDVDTLQRILNEEREKNDVAWAKVKEQNEQLTDRPAEFTGVRSTDAEANMKAKETELALLEYEIAYINQGLSKLDPPNSDDIAALLVRATIASAVQQYERGLAELNEELDTLRARLDDDHDMLHELNEVRIGLERRKSVLTERRQTDDLSSVERKLLARVDRMENDLGSLLRSLINISNKLFVDREGVQQAQLRHLIDRLINKAWDTPADPYVDVAEDYLPVIPAFLLRANVAIEHPRNAHRIRLIEFHRPTVG